MFDDIDENERPVGRAQPEMPPPDPENDERKSFDVSQLTVEELLGLRQRIDERLPPMKLEAMDLEKELIIQYQIVKTLQSDTLEKSYVEPNKKASVVNACASALAQVVKLQTDVYTAERFKAVESLMIRALKTLSPEAAAVFLVEYEKLGTKG